MRELIRFTGLVEELNKVFHQDEIKPIVKYKLFEDNNGALELAKAPTYRSRT